MTTVRVAAIQMRSTGDRTANLARADELLREGVARGAVLLALPENFSLLPRRERDKLDAVESPDDGPSVRFLRDFARAHRVALVGGSVPLPARAPGKVTNTCLAVDATGAIVARYDKLHLFDVAVDAEHTFAESSVVEAGRARVTADLCGLRVGLSICYDVRFPELFRAHAADGATLLTVPAAFTVPTGRAHWELLLRARAVENLCFVLAPAQWGRHSEARESFGHSLVVGPWGDVLGRLDEGEGVLVVDLDLAALDDARRRIPALGHVRRDLFG